MPKKIVPLDAGTLSSAKPKEKDYKLYDGGGLYLLVVAAKFNKEGKPLPPSKLWRLKYRFDGKEKLLTLGVYPTVMLAEARQKRDEARRLLDAGQDPAAIRKQEKEQDKKHATTFKLVALEWYSKSAAAWSEGHSSTTINRLTHDVFPCFGNKPISDVTIMNVRDMLRKVADRGAIESAARIKIICGQIFRYAAANGDISLDPSAGLKISEMYPERSANKKHFAAITSPKELAPLLRGIDEYQGTIIVKSALMLAPMLFVRPGELRKMEWAEIDFDAAEWNIPATKMKMKRPHLVPLSEQALKILKNLHRLTGEGQYVLPGRTSSRPMSENTVNAALRYMGFDKESASGHGFRATARTILDEVLGFRVDIIEHQLAHAVKDVHGRAYNRTSFLTDRRKMMQHWADYLDGLKDGAKVLPMNRQQAA